MAIKGCIWYQGESDASCSLLTSANFPVSAQPRFVETYKRIWLRLAKNVRKAFGAGTPFYFMQIASWHTKNDSTDVGFSAVREGLRRAAGEIAAPSGMAVAYDTIGPIGNIGHPDNKKEAASRLAALVLKDVYGAALDAVKSPEAIAVAYDPCGKVTVTFDTVGNGLVKGRLDPLTQNAAAVATTELTVNGFQLSPDGVIWSDAKATVDGTRVLCEYANRTGMHTARYLRYACYDSPCGLVGNLDDASDPTAYVVRRSPCDLYCKTERTSGNASVLPALPIAATSIANDPPLLERADVTSDEKAVSVMSSASDGLRNAIRTAADYDGFKAWVDACDLHQLTAKTDPYALFSYATDQDHIVSGAEVDDIRVTDIRVDDAIVTVKAAFSGFTFGPAPRMRLLTPLFGLTGAIGNFDFSPSKVTSYEVQVKSSSDIVYTVKKPDTEKDKTFFYKATARTH